MLEQQVRNWQGHTLKHYQFLQPLGRGGMGEVWLVNDQQKQRQVAMKLLPSVLASEREHRRMFEREAKIAASLDHPHILPVYDFGEEYVHEDEIVCYLVMPYVSGGTLGERIRSLPGLLPVDEALSYLRQAAEAIDYVHSRQVLHRDVKPANMLLEKGHILLSDFGIARLLNSNTYRSHTHAGAGSPEYMAPEQVQRKAEAASDRYSLGIVAYRLFTGSVPFTGKDPFDVMLKQVKETLPAPCQLNPELLPEVEQILIHALSKRPELRYASCVAFVEALEQAWQDQMFAPTISRLAPLPLPKTGEFIPLSASVPSVPVGLEGSGDVSSLTTDVQEREEESTLALAPMRLNTTTTHKAGTGAGQGWQEKLLSRRSLLIGGGSAAVLAAGGITAAALLHRSAAQPTQPPGPQRLMPGKPLLVLTGHTLVVENVAWSPDGRYLATAGQDTHVMLWDVGPMLAKHQTGVQTISQPTKKWKFTGDIGWSGLHWTSDGRNLLISGLGSAFTLLDPFASTSQRIAFSQANADPTTNFIFYRSAVSRPHSQMLAVADDTLSGSIAVSLWQKNKPDVPVARLTYQLPASGAANHPTLATVAWSSDGSQLAGLLVPQQVIVWDVQKKRLEKTIALPPIKAHGSVTIERAPLAWSPTNPHLLAAFNLDAISIIDTQKGTVLYQLSTNEPDALAYPPDKTIPWYPHLLGMTWSPNGRYVVGGYARSYRMHIWDLQERAPKLDAQGRRLPHLLVPGLGQPLVHRGAIIDLSWSPDGRYMATVGGDLSIVVWQVDA